jgi:glycyl-tRNA synthetase
MKKESSVNDIVARRGIYYQAFGIYKGLAGFYDYGPIGLRIKRKIENLWRSIFIDRTGSFEIETTHIVPEIVLKASGHVDTFTDFITSCEVCKTPYRADKLLEEYYEKKGISGEINNVRRMDAEQLERAINKLGVRCEKCGNKLGKIEKFNLLFKTQAGPYGGETTYLRPETTQGIYVDFIHLYKTHGLKLPVGIAQVGNAYRNEISPRQQLVRAREFAQMELEIFMDPDEEPEEIFGYKIGDVLKTKIEFVTRGKEKGEKISLRELLKGGYLPNRYFALLLYLEDKFLEALGLAPTLYRFREIEQEELPHYSKVNVDLEINTSYGYIEIDGNAYRTDYDLSQHAKSSGEDISVISNGKRLVPHIVEVSMGVGRLLFALIDNAVVEDKDRGWNWLRLDESIAPYKYAVFPLQKDDKLIGKANEIYRIMLEKGVDCYYSETSSIGKRYAKADEIGVPYCITIDYKTLEDDTVTVRNRDTTKQVRRPFVDIL